MAISGEKKIFKRQTLLISILGFFIFGAGYIFALQFGVVFSSHDHSMAHGKIKNQENFLEKYEYVEWDKVKWLNEYSPFLSFMSLYNLASPLFNLLLPLIMLLVPFFLLKIIQNRWILFEKRIPKVIQT